MNNYIVKLQLNIHGYEKIATVGVQAESIDEAGTIALLGECHNEPDLDDGLQSCWDDTMMYSVDGVTEVEDDDEYKKLCVHIPHLHISYGRDLLKQIEEIDREQS